MKSKGYPGGVDVVRGPFSYKTKTVSQDEVNENSRSEYKHGPLVFIMQVDSDGNEYEFAEMNQTGMPGDAEWVVKALNYYSVLGF